MQYPRLNAVHATLLVAVLALSPTLHAQPAKDASVPQASSLAGV